MNAKMCMCKIRDEHGYKLAYLYLDGGSNTKVKISGYQSTFAVTEATRTNRWATRNVNVYSGLKNCV